MHVSSVSRIDHSNEIIPLIPESFIPYFFRIPSPKYDQISKSSP